MNLNFQFEYIHQSPTVSLTDHIARLKANGREIIPLHVGDPDFATPQPILDVAKDALQSGLTHYCPSRGYPELLSAAASKLILDGGMSYDPETEILVTSGGIHAYYLAMQSVLNPGDDVLILDPTWATHANMVVMLRGNVIRVPAPAENDFVPLFEDWEKALTPKTRAIVLNYPSNPTGMFPSREYLIQLHGFARENNLWIVSDEAYRNLYYDEAPVSVWTFEGAKERTILINSLSKTYAMTGWRVGYLAAPSQIIDNALKASQNSITCVAPFVQKAAAFALTDPDMQDAAIKMREIYATRRNLVLQLAEKAKSKKVLTTAPMGAFYFFLDLRSLGISSVEICEQILEDTGVGLIPGSAFGEQGEGFVRMTIAASDVDVEAGFKAILDWAERQ